MGKDLKGKELGTGISQLKDGRYSGRYTNRFGRRMPPIYSWDLKEVKERLRKAKYEDDLGKTQLVHKSITVEEVYKLWIQEQSKKIRESTLYEHRRQYQHDVSAYKYYKITDINENVVDEFISRLIERKLTLGTIIDIKSTFSGIMDCAVSHHLCLLNPFKNYELPKTLKDDHIKRREQRKLTKFLTEEQRRLFIGYIDQSKKCYLKSFYKFLIYTGLRIGEGIALKWEHVDIDNKCIFVQDGYTRYYKDGVLHRVYNGLTKTPTSTRKIPISDIACDVLKEERSRIIGKATGMIFLNTRGEPLKRCNVYGCLKSMINTINKRIPDANLPAITPHWFRHTFATMCLEKDVNPKAVQYILGHASLAMTMDLYSHAAKDFATKEIQKVNQL